MEYKQAFDNARDLDRAREILDRRDNIERKKAEEINVYIIDAEMSSLQNEVLKYQAMIKLPETSYNCITPIGLIKLKDTLYEDYRGHNCDSRNCGFFYYRENERFIHPMTQKQYSATGLVYVCNTTGLAHVCGENCNSKMITSRAEGIVCTISGRSFASVVSVPKDCNNNVTSSENGSHRYNRVDVDMTGCGEFYNDMEIILNDETPKERIKNSFRARNQLEYSRYYNASKRIREEEFNGKNDNRPTRKRRKKTILTNKQKLRKKQISESKTSETIIRDVLLPMEKEAIIDTRIKNKEKEATAAISEYYKKQRKKGKPVFSHKIKQIHAKHTFWAYKTMLPILNKAVITEERMTYFNNCIMHIWKIIGNTPYAKLNNINFAECVVSLIYTMKDGFVISLYLTNDNKLLLSPPKDNDSPNNLLPPLENEYINVATPNQTSTLLSKPSYQKINIEFIAKHPSLKDILVPESDIKKLRKSTSRSTRASKKSRYTNVSLMHGKKEIQKCYNSILISISDSPQDIGKYMLSSYIKIIDDI